MRIQASVGVSAKLEHEGESKYNEMRCEEWTDERCSKWRAYERSAEPEAQWKIEWKEDGMGE